VKFFLLTGNDSLTAIEVFELHDSEHFTMGIAGLNVPLGMFYVVDEELNVYLCIRDDDDSKEPVVSGSLLSKLEIPQARLTAIRESINRLRELDW
jgi:hypothetical protein